MTTIARARKLDVLPRVRCPAALPIAGVSPERSGVICGVMLRDRERERGVGMSAGQHAIARAGGDGDVFLTIEKDPQAVENLCCGDAVPVVTDDEIPGNRKSYTYCPVWQTEVDRLEEGREALSVEMAPAPVAHWDDGRGGMRTAPRGSSYDAPDPWAQAQRDVMRVSPDAGATHDDYGPIPR